MIIDANIVVYWIVDTPFYEVAIPFQREQDLIAPHALNIEVISALQRYQNMDRFERGNLTKIPGLLESIFTRFLPDEALLPHAIKIAEEIDHKIYDCLYLALARQTGDKLITADKRLSVIAEELAIPTTLITPS